MSVVDLLKKNAKVVETKPSRQLEKVKPIHHNLDVIRRQLEELAEQTGMAKAFPVALLDSRKLENIFLSMAKEYNKAVKHTLATLESMSKTKSTEELEQFLREQFTPLHRLVDLLNQMADVLELKQQNVELEHEVLTKLKAALET